MQTSFFSNSLKAIQQKGVLNILPVLAVKNEYRLLEPDQHDGFLFDLKPWVSVEFRILIDLPVDNQQIKVVTVYDRDKKIAHKSSITKDKHYLRFVKSVKNRLTGNVPYLSTKHDGNNTRIIFTGSLFGVHRFEMWETAIVTRILDGQAHFFLTIQKLYEADMYNFDGRVYLPETQYPGYQHWSNLQTYLNSVINVETLEKVDLDQMLEILDQESQSNELPVEEKVGVVKYFCLASGLGLAQTSNESAFIHWSKIISNDRLACLAEGQKIQFENMVVGTKEEKPVLFLEGVESESTHSQRATKSCPGNHSKQLFDRDEVEKLTIEGVR